MKRTYFDAAMTTTIFFTIILNVLLLPILGDDGQQLAFANQTIIKNQINNTILNSGNSSVPKVVILNFYDDDIGQFTNGKPILDKYGFKGTFFIVCKWAGSDNNTRMTWQDITQLYREGHDIESHSTHIKF